MKAWDELTPETIVKSFKACALNIPVDGSEDEIIHCFKKNQLYHSGFEMLKQQLDILNKPDVNPFDVPYDDVYETVPQFLTVDEDSEEDIDIEV